MKINRNFKDNKWLPYAIAGCTVVLFYLLVSHINYFFFGVGRFIGFISPVIIGLIIAYVMDPLVKIFENSMMRKTGIEPEFLVKMYRQSAYPETADENAIDQSKARKVRLYRVISVWITVMVVVLVIVILLIALIPQLAKSIGIFISNFDVYADSLQSVLDSFSRNAAKSSIDITSFTNILENSIDKLADYVEHNMGNILNKSVDVGKTIVNIVISFILAIYMLCDKRRLQAGWRRLMQALLSEKTFREGTALWTRCNDILIRYIAGDILDGLIVGLINFLFMSVMGMDYAVLVSVIVSITNLAPTFGPVIGAVVGGLVLVFVNPWWALWFLIFTIIIQTVDGYILKPKLFGSSLGISSLWILISIIVLGRMFGVVGILLAIPAAAIFDIFYKEAVLRRLEAFKTEKNRLKEEEQAKKTAEEAAFKAAKEAIKAVAQKDGSQTEADNALMERLASDADTIKNDI